MSDNRALKRPAAIIFALAAVIVFSVTIYSMVLNRTATAGVAAAFMLALVLIQQLPIVESLEVLTLKVKLRDRLDDAERLLGQLQSHASVTARVMYIQLAFMNRMGSVPWATKRALIDDVDRMLTALELPAESIALYKRPFMNIVSFDLSRIFENSLSIILNEHRRRAEAAFNDYTRVNAVREDDETYQKLNAERRSYEVSPAGLDHPLDDPQLADLETTTARRLRDAPITQQEKDTLEIIRREVCDLSRECWTQQTITVAAEQYLEKYYPRVQTRVEELQSSASS